MDLLVVGAGTMGRWFATAVGDAVDAVAFADRDRAAAEAAAEAVDGPAEVFDGSAQVVDGPTDAVDGPTDSVDDPAEEVDDPAEEVDDPAEEVDDPAEEVDGTTADGTADEPDTYTAVCVAVPMSAVADAIAEHADRAERALLDVAGVMEPAVAEMRTQAPDRERASLHPLFAPGNEPGTVAAVVDERGPVVDRVLEALRSRGNRLVETTPQEHDEAMATIQARAHAAVLAYALAAEDVPEGFQTPVSRRLAAAVADVTGGNPRVYADVQDVFDGAEEVAAAARRIADADREAFERLYAEATTGWADAGPEDGG